jgi:hypothetical protein
VKNFDAEQDYDDFDAWFQELSDENFADFAFTWMESMVAGYAMPRSGSDTFKGWVFDTKWPDVRMAREADRLESLADFARWAA